MNKIFKLAEKFQAQAQDVPYQEDPDIKGEDEYAKQMAERMARDLQFKIRANYQPKDNKYMFVLQMKDEIFRRINAMHKYLVNQGLRKSQLIVGFVDDE